MEDSIKNMKALIKKSKGHFITTVLLILLPVLIINCYMFYSNYTSVINDYTKVESFDFDNITDANYLADFTDALMSVRQAGNTELNATDIVFYIINIAISVFADGFLIIMAVHLLFNKEYKTGHLAMLAIRRCFAVIFFGIIASWAISYVSSAADSSILMLNCFLHAADTSKMAPILFGTTLATTVIHGSIAYFLLSGVMMLVVYCTVVSVSGRCRWFVAPQYVFEVLRGKKFKQLLHFLVPTLLAYFIPAVLSAASMYAGLYAGLIFTGISVIMQTVFNAMLWFRAVPDFFTLEKESGIEERIRGFMRNTENNNINE